MQRLLRLSPPPFLLLPFLPMNTRHQRSIVCPTRGLLPALALLGAAAAAVAPALASASWKDIQFGGFISQGFLVNSGPNDYLGDTSDGTFDFREYAVNASFSTGQWRIGGQLFGQKLGAYGDDEIKLDWAAVDFQAAQWLGFRAGRVKMPRGLYNESLDLDAVRPYILLPQSVYDNRLRDFSASFNGAMIYGNIELKKAGSIDYRVFYGQMPLDIDSGASDFFNIDAPFPNLAIDLDSVRGCSLFWNTPVAGLRAGYSYTGFKDLTTIRYVPFRNANSTKKTDLYGQHLFSLEYMKDDWIFAAELGWESVDYGVTYPNVPPSIFLYWKAHYRALSVSRRINDWFELGAYYSFSDFQQLGVGTPVQMPLTKQGDYALSARFDVNEHLIFKIEGHYMSGSGKIFDIPSHPQPPATRDNSWALFAAKATILF
jgi:hypothetical protein